MAVDLCVVSHNTKAQMIRFSDTLLSDYDPAEDYQLYNLWIADNGSRDGTVEWLQANYGIVEYNENIGYAAACNQLAAKGSNPIIGLLNADVWFTTEDLKKIVRAFDDPEVAILGPKQRNERYRITHAGIEGTNKAPKHRGWQEYDPKDTKYRDKLEMVTVSGSAYFIRRSIWNELTECEIFKRVFPDAIGAFGQFPHYFEETMCSYHARAHGHKVFYDGSISIGHTWLASTPDPLNPKLQEYFQIGRDIFKFFCDSHGIEHNYMV